MKQNRLLQQNTDVPGRQSPRGFLCNGRRISPLTLLLAILLLTLPSLSRPSPAQELQTGAAPEITEGVDSIKVQLGEYDMEVGLVLVRGDREFQDFVPLVVSIFNRSHKLVRIRKDEFHLYGENGVELPLATVKQVRSDYRLYRQDPEILSRSGFLSSLPGIYRPTNFFPPPGSVGVYAVTIDFQQTFIDFLYFVGRWDQRLRLVAEGNKSRPTLEVQFKIEK